jgi:hypothetical protein
MSRKHFLAAVLVSIDRSVALTALGGPGSVPQITDAARQAVDAGYHQHVAGVRKSRMVCRSFLA